MKKLFLIVFLFCFSLEFGYSQEKYVSVSTLNLRENFSADSKIIGKLYKGDKVTIIAIFSESKWVQITTQSGEIGYVNSNYLTSQTSTSNTGSTYSSTSSSSYPTTSSSYSSTSNSSYSAPRSSYSTRRSSSRSSGYKPKYRSSKTYYRGPRGGCYYINSNGNKTYVDRSLCN